MLQTHADRGTLPSEVCLPKESETLLQSQPCTLHSSTREPAEKIEALLQTCNHPNRLYGRVLVAYTFSPPYTLHCHEVMCWAMDRSEQHL